MALFAMLLLRALFQPPTPPPVPNILKATQIAKTFEPLILYSEHGVQQISTLQDTSVAVWDLGESVDSTNMPSSPIIARTLNELSESLKILVEDLTRFFVQVDADIDKYVLFPSTLSPPGLLGIRMLKLMI